MHCSGRALRSGGYAMHDDAMAWHNNAMRSKGRVRLGTELLWRSEVQCCSGMAQCRPAMLRLGKAMRRMGIVMLS